MEDQQIEGAGWLKASPDGFNLCKLVEAGGASWCMLPAAPLTFPAAFPPSICAGRRLQAVLQNPDGTMPLIFAAGAMLRDGTPIQHYATAQDAPPLLVGDAAAAAAAGGEVQGQEDEDKSSMKAVSLGLQVVWSTAATGWVPKLRL